MSNTEPVTHCPQCNAKGLEISRTGLVAMMRCYNCGVAWKTLAPPQKPKQKPGRMSRALEL